MLSDFTGAGRGYTELRLGIDGLAALVKQQFLLDSLGGLPVSFLRKKPGPD